MCHLLNVDVSIHWYKDNKKKQEIPQSHTADQPTAPSILFAWYNISKRNITKSLYIIFAKFDIDLMLT